VTEGSHNCAVFVVLGDCQPLRDVRDKLDLRHQDFHITVGFKQNDIHGVQKNSKTIISRMGVTKKLSNDDDNDDNENDVATESGDKTNDDDDALATRLAKYL